MILLTLSVITYHSSCVSSFCSVSHVLIVPPCFSLRLHVYLTELLSIVNTVSPLYVAMSCVRESGDLRILFHDSVAAARNLSLRYISNLRHSVHVLNYYDGFRSPVLGVWDLSLSLLAAQCVP